MNHLRNMSFVVMLASFALGGALCEQPECTADIDCAEGVCSPEQTCVACNAAGDCGAGEFCCQHECFPDDEMEQHCGCAPDGDNEGTVCGGERNICLVGDARAALEFVEDGLCGCACTAIGGGTDCVVDTEAELGYGCQCNRNDPVGTCEAVTVDTQGRPHIAADTCTAQNRCQCLTEGNPCGTAGLPPDCSLGQCVSLRQDVANCGIAERDCSEPDQGLADGTGVCVDGGCQCDAAGDCQGTALNANTCAFVGGGAVSQCVCQDYTVAGENAACPMGLECVEGGCNYSGQVVASEENLLTLIGQ